MTKKRSRHPFLPALTLALALLLCLGSVTALAAETAAPAAATDLSNPEEAFQAGMTAFQTMDYQTFASYFSGISADTYDTKQDYTRKICQAVSKNFSWEVHSVTREGGKVFLNVSIQNSKFTDVKRNVMIDIVKGYLRDEYLDEEELMLFYFQNPEKLTTITLTVEGRLMDGKWVFVGDKDFENAVWGDYDTGVADFYRRVDDFYNTIYAMDYDTYYDLYFDDYGYYNMVLDYLT